MKKFSKQFTSYIATPSHTLKKMALALSVMVVCGFGVWLFWPLVQSLYQPADAQVRQAVAQIEAAVSSRNTLRFEQLVESGRLASGVIAQVFEPAGVAGVPLSDSIHRRYTELVLPELSALLGAQINERVATGRRMGEGGTFLDKLWREIFSAQWAYNGIKRVVEDKTTALVTVEVVNKTLSLPLAVELRLQKRGKKSWKLVGVENTARLMERVEKTRLQKLAAVNVQKAQVMEKALQVSGISKSSGVQNWGAGPAVMLRATFTNTGEKPVAAFRVLVRFRGLDGRLLKAVRITDNDPLPAGARVEKSWPISINPLVPFEKQLYELQHKDLSITVEPQSLTFEDGEQLALEKTL